MAGGNDWLPSRNAQRAVVMQNINDKIDGYTAILPLTTAQVTGLKLACSVWLAAYTYYEQYRSSSTSTGTWRDRVWNGTSDGSAVPDPPTPPVNGMPAGAKIGVIQQIRDYREQILAAPGYTGAIGEDLMIVATGGGSGPKVPTDEATPDLKCVPASGYEVSIAGPMHGMDAMRIEWQSNGDASWSLIGFLTKTPGVVHPSPKVPGQPESGRIRARYIHNNDPVGNYSPEYAVTISA